MALISDTQINGVLSLTRPLTHEFPTGETRVSSALIIGDLQARAHTLFAQQTWTGEWQDSRIGAATIEALGAYAGHRHISLFAAVFEEGLTQHLNAKQLHGVQEFAAYINRLQYRAPREPAAQLDVTA